MRSLSLCKNHHCALSLKRLFMNSFTFFLSQMTFALKQVIFARGKKGHLWAISISHLSIFFAWQSVTHPPQCWTEKKLSQRKKKNKESDDWAKERRKIENKKSQYLIEHKSYDIPPEEEVKFLSMTDSRDLWPMNNSSSHAGKERSFEFWMVKQDWSKEKLVVDWSTSHCPIIVCASIPVHNKFDSKLARGHGQQICKLPLPVVGKPVRGMQISLICKMLTCKIVNCRFKVTCTEKQVLRGLISAARRPGFPSWNTHPRRGWPAFAGEVFVEASSRPPRWGSARRRPRRWPRTPCTRRSPAPCPSRTRPLGECGTRSQPGVSTKCPEVQAVCKRILRKLSSNMSDEVSWKLASASSDHLSGSRIMWDTWVSWFWKFKPNLTRLTIMIPSSLVTPDSTGTLLNSPSIMASL